MEISYRRGKSGIRPTLGEPFWLAARLCSMDSFVELVMVKIPMFGKIVGYQVLSVANRSVQNQVPQ